MGTVEPIYQDDNLIIKDDTIAFIYGAIKKYGNIKESYNDLKKYISTIIQP